MSARSFPNALSLATFAVCLALPLAGQTRASSSYGAGKPDFDARFAEFKEQRKIEEAQSAKDRAELVRPAPPDFKPKATGRKVELRLVLRDTRIKQGGTVWYRLELQNVGSENARVWDRRAFFKTPTVVSSIKWEFYLTKPDGTRERVFTGPKTRQKWRSEPQKPLPDASKMSEKEAQDFLNRTNWTYAASRNLDLTLLPGETLVSRGWRWLDHWEDPYASEGDAAVKSGWTELMSVKDLWLQPGDYRLDVIMRDEPPPPLTEAQIKEDVGIGLPRERVLKDHEELRAGYLGTTHAKPVRVTVQP